MVNVSKNYSNQRRHLKWYRNGDGKEEGRIKGERKEKGARTGEQADWEEDTSFIQVMTSEQAKIGESVVKSL